MYPVGQLEINPSVDLYVRNVTPESPPIGVSTNTNNIDTVLYQNYVNGGAIGDSYGLTKATSVQKQQLQQMQTKMNLLSNQINNLTNQFTSGGQQVNQQSETNIQGINNYVKDIKKINKKIKNYDTNYENILQDSDVVVLQQNYDYLFWSIIAVTTVIISMNIVKK
jgi:seryl-tRNA synthetase